MFLEGAGCRERAASGAPGCLRSCLSGSVHGLERLQHHLPDAVLSVGVINRSQQREVATLAVDDERARGEGDVDAGAVAALPDSEPDQLQAVEFSAEEVQFSVGEFRAGARR